MIERVTLKIGENDLILETGKMAKQANGAVYATYGGSEVLATVCAGREVTGLDYVPLQVEYNEKYYAAGKIPGGFLKREGRPKDKEVLVSRLIDRPMRPLFSKKFGRDIQVIPTVISTDQINPPDIVAMIAASAAVVISDVPFNGPVGAVRVCALGDELFVNPTFEQIEKSDLDIIVSGTEEGITMVEGGAKEVAEELMLEAIEKAHGTIIELCKIQKQLRELAGKEKLPLVDEVETLDGAEEVQSFAQPKLEEACFVLGKMKRIKAIKAVKEETLKEFQEKISEEQLDLFDKLFEDMESQIVRKSILEKGIRTDGRGSTEIRPISCEIDTLSRTHGSALFTRGETQALAITTLGTVMDEQMKDDIDGEKRYENFMLHYNFPPFSVGETRRLGTGRREIGHGHLAHRAIAGVLPAKDDFPYTIRVVSEILESNGSSSMATVCGSSLSLFNAGVPLKRQVAGIAMGLVADNEKTVVISDILGEEDHLGDMDFKVAGTKVGITAFQMDIKISNVSFQVLASALAQAKEGRLYILEIMNKTLDKPNTTLSQYAPKIVSFHVEPDKIGAIIGPGGKTIKGITEKTAANVNIDDTGKVTIYGKTQDSAESAANYVKALVEDPEVGKVYNGVVKRIMDFGAFIEILPGKEGLCHISKLSKTRINSVRDVVTEDQEITVKLVEIDRMGRLNLSHIDTEPGAPATAGRDSHERRTDSHERGRNSHERRNAPPRRNDQRKPFRR